MMRRRCADWALGALSLLFWLGLWEAGARHLQLPFAIPTVGATLEALSRLLGQGATYDTVFRSCLRILTGLGVGTVLGILLSALTLRSRVAQAIIAPAVRVVRCVPVASFIMVLWILTGRDAVPTAIALLMVLPVIWQALRDHAAQLDRQLDEVLRVYRVGPLRRFRLLVVPGLAGCFLSALRTAAGLAWKAGIAAEIIAYSAHSIGRKISDARMMLDGAEMMAWTVLVIVLSLAIEGCFSLLRRGVKGGGSHAA